MHPGMQITDHQRYLDRLDEHEVKSTGRFVPAITRSVALATTFRKA